LQNNLDKMRKSHFGSSMKPTFLSFSTPACLQKIIVSEDFKQKKQVTYLGAGQTSSFSFQPV